MVKVVMIALLVPALSWSGARGQRPEKSECAPQSGFSPVVVENAAQLVTFKCEDATALDVIRAVGYQTRIPIGVILGENFDALTDTRQRYDLEHVKARFALMSALHGKGYILKYEDGVAIITATRFTSRQSALLAKQYPNVSFRDGQTMTFYSYMLETRLRSNAMNPAPKGIMGSVSSSTNDETFRLTLAPHPTIPQIANQIVSHGSDGIWVWKVGASDPSGETTDEFVLTPYQHYSNQPVVSH